MVGGRGREGVAGGAPNCPTSSYSSSLSGRPLYECLHVYVVSVSSYEAVLFTA